MTTHPKMLALFRRIEKERTEGISCKSFIQKKKGERGYIPVSDPDVSLGRPCNI